jgi:hypothetical protein
VRDASGLTGDGGQSVSAVVDTLVFAYGLHPADVTRIPAGTATVNYLVTDHSGGQWFAKVYRDRTVLQRERDAVELAEFARAGRVPVPEVRRTRDGRLVEDTGPLPMSLWQYIADAETAESGLTEADGRRSAQSSANSTAVSPIIPQPRPGCGRGSEWSTCIGPAPTSIG